MKSEAPLRAAVHFHTPALNPLFEPNVLKNPKVLICMNICLDFWELTECPFVLGAP